MLESQAPFDTQKLGFVERMDAPMGPGSRWVELGPGNGETSLVLPIYVTCF